MTVLTPSDVDAVRSTVRAFLADRSPLSSVRHLFHYSVRHLLDDSGRHLLDDSVGHLLEGENDGSGGPDRTVWKALVAELGLHAIAIPQVYGGAGYDFAGPAVVLEELGRSLAPVPYLASAVLATQVLCAAGSEQARRTWLPRLAAGEITATVAFVGVDPQWTPTASPLAFDGNRVTGRAAYVPDAAFADVVVVVGPDAVGIVAVDADGVTMGQEPALDPTRPFSTVDFDAARVERVGGAGVGRALDVATVALACEQLGGAEQVLGLTVAYACTRHQFGRAIGSFQAIKHMLADARVDIEAAAAAVRHAVALVDAGDDRELAEAASVAKSAVSDAYWEVARDAVQVHGAIGFTWEHDLHLYLRRALVSREFLGSPQWHRERLAVTLLDE
jgi:alkylation response protein AidB-like acyl-CoA dehydrogenase